MRHARTLVLLLGLAACVDRRALTHRDPNADVEVPHSTSKLPLPADPLFVTIDREGVYVEAYDQPVVRRPRDDGHAGFAAVDKIHGKQSDWVLSPLRMALEARLQERQPRPKFAVVVVDRRVAFREAAEVWHTLAGQQLEPLLAVATEAGPRAIRLIPRPRYGSCGTSARSFELRIRPEGAAYALDLWRSPEDLERDAMQAALVQVSATMYGTYTTVATPSPPAHDLEVGSLGPSCREKGEGPAVAPRPDGTADPLALFACIGEVLRRAGEAPEETWVPIGVVPTGETTIERLVEALDVANDAVATKYPGTTGYDALPMFDAAKLAD